MTSTADRTHKLYTPPYLTLPTCTYTATITEMYHIGHTKRVPTTMTSRRAPPSIYKFITFRAAFYNNSCTLALPIDTRTQKLYYCTISGLPHTRSYLPPSPPFFSVSGPKPIAPPPPSLALAFCIGPESNSTPHPTPPHTHHSCPLLNPGSTAGYFTHLLSNMSCSIDQTAISTPSHTTPSPITHTTVTKLSPIN